MDERQTTLFDVPDDDDLNIIGTPRDAFTPQSHSTFRKIDGAVKVGKFVSLSWGELMVMLPRPLYEEVYAYATRGTQSSRAAAIAELLTQGLVACSE